MPSIDRGEFDRLLEKITANDPKVGEVNLFWKLIGDAGAKEVAVALRGNTSVTSIDLRINRIGVEGARALAETLCVNSAITSLNLVRNSIGDDGLRALAEMLRRNSVIAYLGLETNDIGDKGATALAEALQVNSSITWIDLDVCNSVNEVLRSKIERLVTINRESSSPEEARRRKAAEFGPALAQSSQPLEGADEKSDEESVGAARTMDDAVISFIEGEEFDCLLERIEGGDSSLREVNLNGKGIGDAGTTRLAKALREDVTLTWPNGTRHPLHRDKYVTTLSLWNNGISAEGARALAEMLRTNSTVTELALRGNSIRDDGARALAEALESNCSITELNLDDNGIGNDLKSKVERMVMINRESCSSEDARRRKAAESGPPATPSSVVAANDQSALVGPEAVATGAASQPASAVGALASTRNERAEQERRDLELAERLQREENERARGAAAPAEFTAVGRPAHAALTQTQPCVRNLAPEEQAAVALLAKNMDILEQLRSLTPDELKAVAVLAKNVDDFERSLESVRGLPEALAGASPEVSAYFFTFARSFERTFVAARAIASGAVRVQLSSMKDQMLEGVLKVIGGGAEGCGVPFAGLISIVAAVIVFQRETRQTNLLHVFREFFEGNSRDQYLITYRKLAEQICLRLDFATYFSRPEGRISQDRARVVKLLEPIKKRLQSAHFLAIENLQLVEVKATADLAALTEGVLRLHFDDRGKFCVLKDGGDQEKIRYLLHVLGLDDSCARPGTDRPHTRSNPSESRTTTSPCRSPGPATAGEASAQHISTPSPSATGENPGLSSAVHPSHSSRFGEIEREIKRLREENRQLRSGDRRANALHQRLEKLERKVGGQRDIETGAGGGGQAQAQLQRSRNAHSREGATAESAAYQNFQREVLLELQEIRAGLAQVAERGDATALDTFLLSHVLQLREALELIRSILQLARVEVSSCGAFKVDGKHHKVGFVTSGLFSRPKYLWKGVRRVKVMQEHDGAKPVVYWFEKCGLSYLFEMHIKNAAVKIFGSDLCLVASGDSTSVIPSKGSSQDRQQLFNQG